MKNPLEEYTVLKLLFIAGIIITILALTSCENVDFEQLGIEPDENGIVCAEIEVDGYLTDSSASYRYIEAGESVVLTADLVESLCPGF